MRKWVRRFVQGGQGCDLVECALLLALIALVMVAGVRCAEQVIQGPFDRVGPLPARAN
jgi:Flp pilus assembly pilin Flp